MPRPDEGSSTSRSGEPELFSGIRPASSKYIPNSPSQGSVGEGGVRNEGAPPLDRMLKWFEFAHLPESLRNVSWQFHALAHFMVVNMESGPERTVALRKLLEAKDAAVRAKLHPGG